MMNNGFMNNFNQMGMNMNIVVNKMDLINHLTNMNTMMQNQIEQNNFLILKLINEPVLNQNFSNFIPNNNQIFPLNNFQQNINPPLNNQVEDYFPNHMEKRINIEFRRTTGKKHVLLVPVNATINELLLAFMKKVKLGDNLIGEKISFIYNGKSLKKGDNMKISQLGMGDCSKIIVVDINNILG